MGKLAVVRPSDAMPPSSEVASVAPLTRAESNRRNALKSTGPRTAAGKKRSSANALRHGLLCAPSIIGGESPREYRALYCRLRDDLRPVGAVEELLLDRVVSCTWRLRRAVFIDSVLMEIERRNRSPYSNQPEVPSNAFVRRETTMEVVSKYECAIERSLWRALALLMELCAQRNRNDKSDDAYRCNESSAQSQTPIALIDKPSAAINTAQPDELRATAVRVGRDSA